MGESTAKNTKYFSALPLEKLFEELNTSPTGLTEKEAKRRLERGGLNVIADQKERNIVLEFLSHFQNPLVIVLLVAAAISAFLGEIRNFVIISLMVLAGVALDFFQEYSAGNAAKKLKEKIVATATVIRQGEKREISAKKVCVGDIIFLSSGDLVPADAIVIKSDDFFVNQSSLTGESFPVEKNPKQEESGEPVNDNVVFLGSSVVSGTALAVVFRTGQNTEFGNIAKSLLRKEEKSGFELGVANFGYFIMKITLVLVLFIFLGNALAKHNILESFVFAIAVAVGITPELLPMVMSVTMAYSAKKMSREGVLVKKLSAIPNLGSMDILCTDKTGTLTEDKIKLILYSDIFGNEDDQVFLYTYLNSFYQTGIKNPLDKAVLEYKKTAIEHYTKIEEIPYDFGRKMMSIAVQKAGQRILIAKGAPENIIERCRFYRRGNTSKIIDAETKETALAYYQKLSADGYRVLAVAIKTDLPPKNKYTAADENELTLVGFAAFFDPIKKGVETVLKSLHDYGVEIKIVTGDNEWVTQKICRDLGINIKGVLLGKDIQNLSDDALAARAENTTIFARFSPNEKNRLIRALRLRGHIVGYLGDGINDAPSLKIADVGISVDNAVDVAKETADIILTKKQLDSVIDGILGGRRSFANTMKYIMMGLSSNFGNMFSVLGAVFYLPFLPMLPIQILLNNFIYDLSQITIPADAVDKDWIARPRKWNIKSVKKFMYLFGPISSAFDFLTFFLLFSVFRLEPSAFQTGWFLESLATQTLVIHIIRTKRIPFLQSRASAPLTFSTLAGVVLAWLVPFSSFGKWFGFTPLPFPILLVISGLVLAYLIIVELAKRAYYRKYDY